SMSQVMRARLRYSGGSSIFAAKSGWTLGMSRADRMVGLTGSRTPMMGPPVSVGAGELAELDAGCLVLECLLHQVDDEGAGLHGGRPAVARDHADEVPLGVGL